MHIPPARKWGYAYGSPPNTWRQSPVAQSPAAQSPVETEPAAQSPLEGHEQIVTPITPKRTPSQKKKSSVRDRRKYYNQFPNIGDYTAAVETEPVETESVETEPASSIQPTGMGPSHSHWKDRLTVGNTGRPSMFPELNKNPLTPAQTHAIWRAMNR